MGVTDVRRFAQLALAALLGFASPAIAADRAQETCEQSKRGGQDWDKQIIGCSAVLSRSSLTNGDRAITLENRAFANEGKGDHDRAIADYDEAIRLEPNNASAYAGRGRVFEKKGDPRRALADFNKALTLQSDLPGAIAGRDRVRAALAAVPGAETPAVAPTPVVAAPPASQAPPAILGNGDSDRALSTVEDTIRLDPKNASAYAKRGIIFERKGDLRRALADFNKALTLQGDLSSAIAGRDRMRAALAKVPVAATLAPPNAQTPPVVDPTPPIPSATPTPVAVASPAMQARPPAVAPAVDQDWEACQQAVQVVHDRDKQIAGCTRILSRGSKETGTNRETAFVRRGEAYNDKGDRGRAIADFSDAIRINPFDAEALLYLAVATGSAPARPTFAPPVAPAPALVTESPTGPASRPAATAAPAPTPTATSVAALPAAPAPPPTAAPAPLGRRVALIVANHAYAAAPLANPPIDAGLVKASLEKVGFSVVVRNDLDLEAFEQAIADFAETSRGADVALFYFAGHGFSIAASGRQQNLLMATSANFAAKSALVLQGGGEPLEHVEETIIGHARATLIFIDACRNIPALAGRGAGSRGFAPSDTNPEGAYVVLSTRQGMMAEDGVGGQGSPFARAFASVLPTPGLRIEDAYYRIRDKVRQETSGEQVPDAIRSDLPEGGVVLLSAVQR
jgi:tetratricopeptide (TPR) repeat protein